MLERLSDAPSDQLSLEEYYREFSSHFQQITTEFAKFERRQHFIEPGNPSWEAFNAGDWNEALRLADEGRHEIRESNLDARRRGLRINRLRVIERPLTPYLQWEMHILKVRADEGDDIRVLDAADLAGFERSRLLPEVVILGDRVMYNVLYNENGRSYGALRFDDSDVIQACSVDFTRFFAGGEDIASFFAQHVLALPPPRATSSV